MVRRLPQDDQGSFQGAGHGKGLVRPVIALFDFLLCFETTRLKRLVYWFLFVRFIALFYERKYCIILIRN